MVKRKKTIWLSLPPVLLYLNDLKRIETVLTDNNFDVKYITPDYECASIDELVNSYKEDRWITELEVEGRRDKKDSYDRDSVSVHLDKDATRIYGNQDSAELDGITSKLNTLLRKHSSLFFRMLRMSFVPLILQLTISFSYYAFIYHRGEQAKTIANLLLFPLSLVVNFWLFSGLYLGTKRRNVIVLLNRSEQSSYWSRNKDQLITNAICLVLGSLITLGIEHLAKDTSKEAATTQPSKL